MLENLDNSYKHNYLIFMDNVYIHCTFDLMEFYSKNKLKILLNVPYAFFYNMAELVFSSIKKIIYGFIFSSIEEVEDKVIKILEGEKLNSQIPFLFKETLREYNKFLAQNFGFN